ncbi:MAG: S8 family serine peptidase [bacterium]|nr:S8 family serine peptidase [bacterium]
MKRPELCDHFFLHGKRYVIKKHPSDFAIMKKSGKLPEKIKNNAKEAGSQIPDDLTSQYDSDSRPTLRLSVEIRKATGGNVEEAMAEAKTHPGCMVSHVFLLEGTDEEILFSNTITLDLEKEDKAFLRSILEDYDLDYQRRMGDSHILSLPVQGELEVMELANMLNKAAGVKSCSPGMMIKIVPHANLYPHQWNLNARNLENEELLPDADISMEGAWEFTKGAADTVLAIIDDGFDLGHPCLENVTIHDDALNYSDGSGNVQSRGYDYHGTSVASQAFAQHVDGSIRGVAPDCTFLPIRIEFGYVTELDYFDLFQYVSQRADVLSCSFGHAPGSVPYFTWGFRWELTQLTETGGRKGNGLVMVFSAGNDDAPTVMSEEDNVNGVFFWSDSKIKEIPAGNAIYTGYPNCDGVIAVGAMSALKRKAGYSNFGPDITVVAPSGNYHNIPLLIPPGTPDREMFVADYPGPALAAAINRDGHGIFPTEVECYDPDFEVIVVDEIYTLSFSGTSAAAPTVTAVAALMLSVNGNLTAEQVRQIIQETADKDLDPSLDNPNDPNVQGLFGEFIDGRSFYFGAGKLNAAKAVAEAKKRMKDEV